MSELIHKIFEGLQKDKTDYEGILSSLVLAKGLIDKIKETNIGIEIIIKIFKNKCCYKDPKIYYYELECNKISMNYCKWKPEKNCCIESALKIINDICIELFSDMMKAFSEYLTTDISNKNFDDYLTVINAICDILQQRIFFYRTVKKETVSII